MGQVRASSEVATRVTSPTEERQDPTVELSLNVQV